jgi:hypothetical protein
MQQACQFLQQGEPQTRPDGRRYRTISAARVSLFALVDERRTAIDFDPGAIALSRSDANDHASL